MKTKLPPRSAMMSFLTTPESSTEDSTEISQKGNTKGIAKKTSQKDKTKCAAEKTPPTAPAAAPEAPAAGSLPKRERKSCNVAYKLPPSTVSYLRQIAEANDLSVNETLNQLIIKEFVAEYKATETGER